MAQAPLLPNLKKKATKKKIQPPAKPPTLSSWEQFKNLLSCRSTAASRVHDPAIPPRLCGSSTCSFKDVVHGTTRVIHRSDPEGMSLSDHLSRSGRRVTVKGGNGMQLRSLSGCYECQAVSVQPQSRYPRPRALSSCSDCGEVFTKAESLELHQTLRHAVSELGPEDSGRSIVEIIFKSSWLKKDSPIFTIERILKVHNSHRTIASFESYRDAVKSRAATTTTRHHRCAADGNELLRFHCTSLSCSLGARGSTSLCLTSHSTTTVSATPCGVCTIIRHGFSRNVSSVHGVRTTASSGKGHDCGPTVAADGRRAMLVCRVIAGRVRRARDEMMTEENGGGYDSVAGGGDGGVNLEELFVASPKAILPCFVVIYRTLDS